MPAHCHVHLVLDGDRAGLGVLVRDDRDALALQLADGRVQGALGGHGAGVHARDRLDGRSEERLLRPLDHLQVVPGQYSGHAIDCRGHLLRPHGRAFANPLEVILVGCAQKALRRGAHLPVDLLRPLLDIAPQLGRMGLRQEVQLHDRPLVEPVDADERGDQVVEHLGLYVVVHGGDGVAGFHL